MAGGELERRELEPGELEHRELEPSRTGKPRTGTRRTGTRRTGTPRGTRTHVARQRRSVIALGRLRRHRGRTSPRSQPTRCLSRCRDLRREMSAGHAEIVAPPKRARSTGTLGPAAAVYLLVVVAAAAILSVPFHVRPASHTDWLLFVVLTVSAGAAQLLPVQTPTFQAYYTTTVFFVAGALLLPPQLLALMIVFAHLPEWARYRYPWYIQTFNIAKWICASLAVYFVCGAFVDRTDISSQIGRLALVGRRRLGCLRPGRPPAARPHAPPRARQVVPRERPLQLRQPFDRDRARTARRRPRSRVGAPAGARAARARAARRRLPVAPAPEPRDGGPARLKDRALQRPLLRERAGRRARAREAVRAPTVHRARRPRPLARGEQHPRAPRRRRGAPRRGRRASLSSCARSTFPGGSAARSSRSLSRKQVTRRPWRSRSASAPPSRLRSSGCRAGTGS